MTHSRRPKAYSFLLGLVALVAMSACSVSTAHLTDLKTSASKDMSNPTTTFAANDTVYAIGRRKHPQQSHTAVAFIAENVRHSPNSFKNNVSPTTSTDGTSVR